MVSFFGEVNRMSLFCREIMLYNEFVPALEPEKHNWEYRAYGHYDGIGIGKKIEFQNGLPAPTPDVRSSPPATSKKVQFSRRRCLPTSVPARESHLKR